MGDDQGQPKPDDAPEPSMEDVLASIRRILADESTAAEPENDVDGDAKAAPSADVAPQASPVEADPPEDPTPEPVSEPGVPSRADVDSDTELALTDDDMDDESSFEEPPTRIDDMPSPPPPPEDEVFMLTPKMKATAENKLLSDATSESSTDVLAQLAKAMLDRRDMAVGGREATLEDMVRSMLRPLLKEWLDRNLPYIIERLVKKEIDIMVNRAERLED